MKALSHVGFLVLAMLTLRVSAEESVVTVDSIAGLRDYGVRDGVRVKMKPGVYVLDAAMSYRFIELKGSSNFFDLRGVTLRVDTQLFSKFGVPPGADGFYRVIDLSGAHTTLEGAKIETFGDHPGIQSRNKIINVTGSGAVVRDVDITTSGSSPWGYGSLFGISGGVVRKLNGIRVGWPAVGAKLIGCRVNMRAMGHGIFVQGASDTLIEDCHVDGLLRRTDEILAEKSGIAFERGFKTDGKEYVEGIAVGANGEILPGEMISLSEDGIRMYDAGAGHPTGPTTIRRCTVRQMRRGFCTGLGPAADKVIDCEARDCVAAGFNVSSGDVLERCRADAKYSEALSCPYPKSQGARVDLKILDSRGGLSNRLLATINGRKHHITLRSDDPSLVPADFVIALGTRQGYGFYQREVTAPQDLQLTNETAARIIRDGLK